MLRVGISNSQARHSNQLAHPLQSSLQQHNSVHTYNTNRLTPFERQAAYIYGTTQILQRRLEVSIIQNNTRLTQLHTNNKLSLSAEILLGIDDDCNGCAS